MAVEKSPSDTLELPPNATDPEPEAVPLEPPNTAALEPDAVLVLEIQTEFELVALAKLPIAMLLEPLAP